MDEVLLGTVPNRPMTLAQRRAHTLLADAEKRLIWVLVWKPEDTHRIERCEASVSRHLTIWKEVCS